MHCQAAVTTYYVSSGLRHFQSRRRRVKRHPVAIYIASNQLLYRDPMPLIYGRLLSSQTKACVSLHSTPKFMQYYTQTHDPVRRME